MDKDQMKKMLGMDSGSSVPFYKLNKVQMSGDDGTFKLADLLSEREKGVKPTSEDLGKTLSGVILKMRWAMSKYDEDGPFVSSTEYDNKNLDEVMIFPDKTKGKAFAMKERYGLSTQRVIYFYLPAKKEIVRLIIKASGLTGDKNPDKEQGLFEYIDEFNETQTLPCEYITECTGVFREGKNKDGSPNRRKDHYATSFKLGRKLTETEFEKIQTLMIEVNEKCNTPKAEVSVPDEFDSQEKALDEALNDGSGINQDDIPF